MYTKIRFSEIENKVPTQPGIYEIHTDAGVPLKVGISKNIKDRLIKHRNSKQNRLKLKPGGKWSRPEDVLSKQSVLAKHMYFDTTLTSNHDLRTEIERRRFLEACCNIRFCVMLSRNDARSLERKKERSRAFRYFGRVRKR